MLHRCDKTPPGRSCPRVVSAAAGVAFGVLLLLGSVHATRATVGGPVWLVPLGYDRVQQRVYWRYDTNAESEELATRVYFFDLRDPAPRIRVMEGRPAATLVALVDHLTPVLSRRPRVIATERVRVGEDWISRYRIGIALPADALAGVEVMAFDSLAVAIPHDFEIPGRRDHLFVVAFIGDPSEETYETQVPVLWPLRATHPVIDWNLPRP